MHINDLPNEILSEIFDAAIVKYYPTPNKLAPLLVSYRKKFCPFNLIQVCRHWRVVAFSNPTLWTFLDGTQHESFRPSLPAMKYWLASSRNASLHLRISSWQDLEDEHDIRRRSFDRQHARKMLQLFSEHLSRWRSLSIEAGNDLGLDLVALLRSARDNPPPLEGLEIELRYGDIDPYVADDVAAAVYNLKTVRRLHWTNAWTNTLPHLPWSQYETLSIRASFTPEESVQLLAQCTSAKSVVIEGSQLVEHPLSLLNRPRSYLPCLTSLTLNQSSDPLPFLSYFTLPSLRYLSLRLYQREFRHLGDFLQRSKCPLEVLTVIETTTTVNDMVDLFNLPGLQAVSTLKVAPRYKDKEVLKLLKGCLAAGARLPPLMVWREMDSEWPFFIGWKENGLDGVRYLLQAGRLTSM